MFWFKNGVSRVNIVFQQFFEEKFLKCYHVLGQECVAYKVLNSKKKLAPKVLITTDRFTNGVPIRS